MTEQKQDQWAQWLLERRHGGDTAKQKATLKALMPVRDKVLQNARLEQGETLLDVGCGDGLIAFGALPLVGEHGKAIFSDISQDLLDHCRSLSLQMGALHRCQFIHAPAENLQSIKTNSVDALTTRSVLIYVASKQLAFNEFYRVLKPGGRLSIFEPINSFTYPEPPHLFYGYDITPIMDIVRKVHCIYEVNQPSKTDPMLNFDEREMIALAEKAGFTEVHLELQIEIVPGKYVTDDEGEQPNWEAFLRSSPNPLAPTLEETMRYALTPGETEQFTAYLRPLFEAKQYVRRFSVAYLWAVKH